MAKKKTRPPKKVRSERANLQTIKAGGETVHTLKAGVNPNTFLHDDSFANSRRASNEFATAGKMSGLLRTALSTLHGIPKKETQTRLTAQMAKLIRTAKAANPLFNDLNMVPLEALRGFSFNKATYLNNILGAGYSINYNRQTWQVVVTIPSFATSIVKRAPYATHFLLFVAVAAIDFNNKQFSQKEHTTTIALEYHTEPAITISLELPAPVVHPLFVVMGVGFLAATNGKLYELSNEQFNALEIVYAVSGIST